MRLEEDRDDDDDEAEVENTPLNGSSASTGSFECWEAVEGERFSGSEQAGEDPNAPPTIFFWSPPSIYKRLPPNMDHVGKQSLAHDP